MSRSLRTLFVAGLLALGSPAAWATSYYLESAPISDRASANHMLEVAKGGGYTARLVRRFELGHGWGFALLVDGFTEPAAAAAAAAKLASSLGVQLSAYKVDDSGATSSTSVAPAATESPTTVADWLQRARTSHGGPSGGTAALARATVVHFSFTRRFTLDGATVKVRHDYWREGQLRRLEVTGEEGGKATDSLAIVGAKGAWMVAAGKTDSRDVGVLVNAVDGFSPEAILTVAVDADQLLSGTDVAGFKVLDGPADVVRLGSGDDASRMSLSFVDLDPATARIRLARYVTEGGPITCEMKDYREVAPGVVIPASVVISRADGRTEEIHVDRLELLTQSPAGEYDAPTGA